MSKEHKMLESLGFNMKAGGVHTSRTIMLHELQVLLASVTASSVTKADYQLAIIRDNCLSKRTENTRKLSFQHLVELYALDIGIPLFRALLFFWHRDTNSRPLIALLCAYARDPILRASTHFLLSFKEGTVVSRQALELYLEQLYPSRFSPATLKSTAQNLNSTWTKSGHLTGKARKVRSQATPTAGALSYALFLGYLSGIRGYALLTSDYVTMINCPVSTAIMLAEEASRKCWIVFKRIGDVVEVLFPNLMNQQELEKLLEQS